MIQLSDTLCFQLVQIRDKIHKGARPFLQEEGLTYGNYITLLILYENPGITQVRLGELNHKDKNVIVQTLDRFEERGLVERRKNQKDRRTYTLHVTARGKQILETYWPVVKGAEDIAFQNLSSEEQRQLRHLIQQVCSQEKENI